MCKDAAIEDGPWVNKEDCKPHMILNDNDACDICDYRPMKLPEVNELTVGLIKTMLALGVALITL